MKRPKKDKVFLKHSKERKLNYRDEDLRWATNELVADWRAERLKCERLADIGCGIGFQSMSFAKKCGRVIAIDISREKIEFAKKNAKELHFKNIEFLEGDALKEEIIEKVKGCDVIFLDPYREEHEDSRSVESIKPDIKEFLKEYGRTTNKIAIEFPPQIKEIPFDCEKEYASVNGKMNRLTLYFGDLKKSERSAVTLPKGTVLTPNSKARIKKTSLPQEHIYEIDAAVQKADLLPELCLATDASLLNDRKQAYFTSEKRIKNDFFKNTYKVLEAVEFKKELVAAALRNHQAGKVLIRYEVKPEEYWQERKKIEETLSGEKQLVLFNFDGLAVICELMK